MSANLPPAFDEWCVVELLGHRRLAARVREHTLAGVGFLRLDEPGGRTQFVSPAAVYALHPVTEPVVVAMAAEWRTDPVARWELPAGPTKPAPMSEDEADEARATMYSPNDDNEPF